jgi:hypothetical protein
MNIQRSWVTPITAGAFLLSGVTGILIFFHMETGANKFVHEWLGWLLLAGAALHVAVNFAGLKSHLASMRGKVVLGVFTAALMASFIPISGESSEPPFMQPMRAGTDARQNEEGRLAAHIGPAKPERSGRSRHEKANACAGKNFGCRRIEARFSEVTSDGMNSTTPAQST